MSFSPDTAVATPTGTKPIAQVKVGDRVIAYDPSTGAASPQTVTATSIHHDDNLVDVTLQVTTPATLQTTNAAGQATTSLSTKTATTVTSPAHATGSHAEVVHITTNHPWLTTDHGWLPASFLTLGEPVVQVDGGTATVVAIHVVAGTAAMWDLTVSSVHTFAVGAGEFVVHNNACSQYEQDVRDLVGDKTPGNVEHAGKGGTTPDAIFDEGGQHETYIEAKETSAGATNQDVFGMDPGQPRGPSAMPQGPAFRVARQLGRYYESGVNFVYYFKNAPAQEVVDTIERFGGYVIHWGGPR